MNNDHIAKTNALRSPQRQCQRRWDTVLEKMGLRIRVGIGNGYISYRFRHKKVINLTIYKKNRHLKKKLKLSTFLPYYYGNQLLIVF